MEAVFGAGDKSERLPRKSSIVKEVSDNEEDDSDDDEEVCCFHPNIFSDVCIKFGLALLFFFFLMS